MAVAAPDLTAAESRALLEVSLIALMLLRPLYAPGAEEVTDFACAYLNPAGQRIFGQPERPAETFLTRFPHARKNGLFAFCCGVFETGEPGRFEVNYQADGLDNYFYFSVQRQGEQLAASFTDTASQGRSAVEAALRASQAAETAARAEAESQRQRFAEVLTELPAQVATYHGPDHVFAFVNPRYERYFPGQELLGRPLREVLPETGEQGILALLDGVYQTGQTHYVQAIEVWLDFARTGERRQVYLDLFFHPLRDAQGCVNGILDFSYDVTEQVRVRQELKQVAAELRLLNEALEQRIEDRTEALRVQADEALAAAAQQLHERETYYQVFEQTPAAIGILRGPQHRLEYLNPACQALFPHQALAGRSLADAVPAAVEQGFVALLDRVYQTGEPHFGYEQPLTLAAGGPPRTRYFTFTFQRFEENGEPAGISVFAYDVSEQVWGREASARQQQRLHELFAQAPISIAVLRGPRYVFELANPVTGQLLGRPVAELLGRGLFEAVPEVAGLGFEALLDGVMATGVPHVAHESPSQIERDGRMEAMYWTYMYHPLREADGRITGVITVATDATEQVRARQRNEALQAEALAAAQRRVEERETFQQVFEHTPALIALLRGPSHRVEYHNPAYQQLVPGRALRGRTIADISPEAVSQGFVALLDRVYQTGEAFFGAEMPLEVGQPPQTTYLNFTYQRFEENGEPAGVSVFAYDVTEQVRARREREAQQQQLEELFLKAPTPILILDGPDLVVQLVNPAYQQIFPGRELAGKPLLAALPELHDTVIPGLLRQVYETGAPCAGQELLLRMARHEGAPLEDLYWDFSYQARRNAHGAVDGVRVFAHDVSAQVRARQQSLDDARHARAMARTLTATNAQLTRVNTDLDTFVYTASHDLKQPIANMEGLLHALQEELPAAVRQTDAVQPMLDRMQRAVDRFKLTIAQLTDVSMLQRAADQPAETVDLTALVDDIRLDLAAVLAGSRARLTVDVTGCPAVSFAPKDLRSVVYNLLSNALKYRHPDRPPVVALRCRSTAAGIVLEVEDNGLGLSAAQQGKLFGLFRRLHDHVEGSGIGLYMVKRIVENAGGTVAVQSAPGVGSTFTVALPATGSGSDK